MLTTNPTPRISAALSVDIDNHYLSVIHGDCNRDLFLDYLTRVIQNKLNLYSTPVVIALDNGTVQLEVLGRLVTIFQGDSISYHITHNYGVSVCNSFSDMLETVCFPLLAGLPTTQNNQQDTAVL